MVMFAVTATLHWLIAAGQGTPNDPLSQQVLARVANPLLTSAQFLIPAAVAIRGIHKMMERRRVTRYVRVLPDGNRFSRRLSPRQISIDRDRPEQPSARRHGRAGSGGCRVLAGTRGRSGAAERRLEARLQRRARLPRH